MNRFRIALALSLLAAVLALVTGGAASAEPTLPPQASDEAREHTHGPDGIDLDRRGRSTVEGFAVDDALTPGGWQSQTPFAIPQYPDAADAVTGSQVHLVYVYPRNAASRFATHAWMIQADARAASELLKDLYGREIRLDTQTNGSLDITPLRSAYTSKQLGGGQQFNYVHQDLLRVFPTSQYPNKKFVAWLDAPSRYCGQGHLYPDTQRSASNASNTQRTTGIVYRPYSASDPNSGGFCRGRTFLHELGHNLGAVQKVAPHAFDGAHCNDDDNDVMCYTAQSPSASTTPQFDYLNDDYWDPGATSGVCPTSTGKLPWWAVNLNRYLVQPGACASNPGY